MVKKSLVPVFLFILLFSKLITAQEIQLFTIEDFDLVGPVKSCLVSTSYGKEQYDFNENGLLTKSVTRFSDHDYNLTNYKYANGKLIEKRIENYSENTLDSTTSIAHFYTIDSTSNLKITEKILSYNKDFLEQYEHYYKNNKLVRIVRTNNEGIDETLVSYSDVKGEKTMVFKLNGVLKKSERVSFKKKKDSIIKKNLLVKKYIKGKRVSALEQEFDGNNKLISKAQFLFNEKTKQFALHEMSTYTYDNNGVLKSSNSTVDEVVSKKEYIYQFDKQGNWVKEIITPDNTYKTRKIDYYAVIEEE